MDGLFGNEPGQSEKFLTVARWRQASQRVVRPDFVVSPEPNIGDFLNL